jgi:bacteriocin-like protein
MSLVKYIERLKRMDQLIRLKATGPPSRFAKSLNISRSTLLLNLQELKSIGIPIAYCRFRRSYFYSTPGKVDIRFEKEVLNNEELNKISGGTNFFLFIKNTSNYYSH